ncbi:MAG: tRNA (adenosine(37)-N6)-dimethylallyltransferase MiaA [Deinococcales bacterium]
MQHVIIPVLAGPTASGKTALALSCEALPVEIVSADAMLVYQDMNIGTAKPSTAERQKLPHHLIDIISPAENFSVASYVEKAESAIEDILGRGKIPLVVGGTGFYIRALSEGLPTVPSADEAVQARFWERFRREGIEPLDALLKAFSPEDSERAQRNPRRVIRALEIIERTGKAPSSFGMTKPKFSYQKAILLPDSEKLEARIKDRTRAMFGAGLIEEVKSLLKRYPERPTAMQAIGYKEVIDYLEGKFDLATLEEKISLATLQYAKRQRTWFRKEPRVGLILTEVDGGGFGLWLEPFLPKPSFKR